MSALWFSQGICPVVELLDHMVVIQVSCLPGVRIYWRSGPFVSLQKDFSERQSGRQKMSVFLTLVRSGKSNIKILADSVSCSLCQKGLEFFLESFIRALIPFLITSQRPHLPPPPWALVFQHVRGVGGHKHSVHNTSFSLHLEVNQLSLHFQSGSYHFNLKLLSLLLPILHAIFISFH